MSLPPTFDDCSEKPFWYAMFGHLQPDLRARISGWRRLQELVRGWCKWRLGQLREGYLTPPRSEFKELDDVVDEWNAVWVKRFCEIHKHFFQAAFWPVLKDQVTSCVQSEVYARVGDLLSKRQKEFEKKLRRPTLNMDASKEDYDTYMSHLEDEIRASGRENKEFQKNEALMSLCFDLEPGISDVLKEKMVQFKARKQDSQQRDTTTEEHGKVVVMKNAEEPRTKPDMPQRLQHQEASQNKQSPPKKVDGKSSDIMSEASAHIKRKREAFFDESSVKRRHLDYGSVGTSPATNARMSRESSLFVKNDNLPSTWPNDTTTVTNEPSNSRTKKLLCKREATKTQGDAPCTGDKVLSPKIPEAQPDISIHKTKHKDKASKKDSDSRSKRGQSRSKSKSQVSSRRTPSSRRTSSPSTDSEAPGSLPRGFRESTAEFYSMTPQSREAMLFRALRQVMREPGLGES